jgi:ABC-2 type transport system permease protein
MNKLINYLGLAWMYIRMNFKAQLEYRGAFLSQAIAMFLNDCMWVAYFVLFFERFPVLKGWHQTEIVTLWAVTAAGFGIAHSLFGNALLLASIIARGQLDVWLLYPRFLLPHVILGRMNASSFGDAIFGYVVYLVIVRPDLPHFALFALLTWTVALLFVGLSILSGSLSFFLGNAEVISEQWRFALITFSTYPFGLFEGRERALLFTLIPAAFVSFFPMEALQHLSLLHAAYSLLGAAAVVLVAVAFFHIGLRRYESGNMIGMYG